MLGHGELVQQAAVDDTGRLVGRVAAPGDAEGVDRRGRRLGPHRLHTVDRRIPTDRRDVEMFRRRVRGAAGADHAGRAECLRRVGPQVDRGDPGESEPGELVGLADPVAADGRDRRRGGATGSLVDAAGEPVLGDRLFDELAVELLGPFLTAERAVGRDHERQAVTESAGHDDPHDTVGRPHGLSRPLEPRGSEARRRGRVGDVDHVHAGEPVSVPVAEVARRPARRVQGDRPAAPAVDDEREAGAVEDHLAHALVGVEAERADLRPLDGVDDRQRPAVDDRVDVAAVRLDQVPLVDPRLLGVGARRAAIGGDGLVGRGRSGAAGVVVFGARRHRRLRHARHDAFEPATAEPVCADLVERMLTDVAEKGVAVVERPERQATAGARAGGSRSRVRRAQVRSRSCRVAASRWSRARPCRSPRTDSSCSRRGRPRLRVR